MNIERMIRSIDELKTKYDTEREKNRFNVFTAMYKDNDEVKLHSRFISYLLCSKSGHGMGNIFFRLFLEEVLKLTEIFDTNNYQVVPNEKDKSEYKEIDILITDSKQAIIIENKIDAKASNHTWKLENDSKADIRYIGQLDRYYHTIFTGIDKDVKKDLKYQRDTIYVYYLNKDGKRSSDLDESTKILKGIPESWKEEKSIISYGNQIRQWLDRCKEVSLEKPSVKEFIQQYLNLINKMTHNDIPLEERLELKNEIAKNFESAKYLIDNFKHVKWHTIHEFWTELYAQLKTPEVYPADDKGLKDEIFKKAIYAIAEGNKVINHGILFDLDSGIRAYISSDEIGLTWGILDKGYFDFENEYTKGIKFSEFSSENTYRLIDNDNMKKVVQLIITEISEEQKNNFKNIKPI